MVSVPSAAKAPASWDGLVQVKSKKLDLVYLMPGADFRGYSKVMIDPTEVAFEKNWRRNYNNSATGLGGRISEDELAKMINEAVPAATDIFTGAWQKGGYAVVTQPGPDVLRVKTGVVNIRVNAPDRNMAARTRSFSSWPRRRPKNRRRQWSAVAHKRQQSRRLSRRRSDLGEPERPRNGRVEGPVADPPITSNQIQRIRPCPNSVLYSED
jgi:hypothetical protein